MMKDQKINTDADKEKLYSQNEVDDMLEKRDYQTAAEQKRTDYRTVADLVKKSNRILVSISSHMLPFDLFPDGLSSTEFSVPLTAVL